MTNTTTDFDGEWKTAQFKRKSTKKWCKGKVGREHVPAVTLDKNFASISEAAGKPPCQIPDENELKNRFPKLYYCSHHVECSTCGKELSWRPDICPTTGLNLSE